MRLTHIGIAIAALALSASIATAQGRPPSPRGHSSTQVGGSYNAEGAYSGGKWIDIRYGRPILRGRTDMFGEGANYSTKIYAGAPIWRIGADVTTRIKTEATLVFDGKTLPPGEYSMFADLANPKAWTLVFSNLGAKDDFRQEKENAVWGGYGYTDNLDVLRATMTVSEHPVSADQLIVTFTDMTQQGGNLTIWFSDQIATIPFTAR
ncbi:MAG: DUF2911 domain-containing protein [Acidobacteria bacterium]|nr:DUF2911 domain-containing protein [Acidobacteriota bacterium]